MNQRELIEEIEKLYPNIIKENYFNLENILIEIKKIILEKSSFYKLLKNIQK
jgi:hypothetical protein